MLVFHLLFIEYIYQYIMNIIQDQIKDVLENNNRAQAQFENILNTYSKEATEIDIKEPLYGELDLSILISNGFLSLNKLTIGEGKLTNVLNIPQKLPKIRVFHCTNNLLTSIENLPSSLEELDVDGNELAELDISNLDNLRVLSARDNRLTMLDHFPETLEELQVAFNQLTQLNFIGANELKTVNLSNNNILRIENLPESVSELIIENNPEIQFINSTLPIQPKQEYRGVQKKMDVYEALDKYFKLENRYAINKQRKRKQDSKPKCVSCNRHVGSTFLKKNNHYIAICGDETSPCNLQIDIFMGNHNTIDEMMAVFKESTEELKVNIIKQKLDTLFNYTAEDESIDNFKQSIDEYNADSAIYKGILDEYQLHFDNDVTKQLIQKYDLDIYHVNEKMKVLIASYKESNNKQLLTDATNMHLKELNPLIQKRRELAYPVMELNHVTLEKKQEVRDDIHGNEYDVLFQLPATLDKLTTTSGEEPKVIKFETDDIAKK